MNITKETFLKAEDAKNRDAMLYAQISLIKRLFLGVAAIFTAISAWLAKS